MHFQFRWLSLCVFVTTSVSAIRAEVDDPLQPEAEWRERAIQFISRIEDEKTLGRALFSINSARLRAGDIEGGIRRSGRCRLRSS